MGRISDKLSFNNLEANQPGRLLSASFNLFTTNGRIRLSRLLALAIAVSGVLKVLRRKVEQMSTRTLAGEEKEIMSSPTNGAAATATYPDSKESVKKRSCLSVLEEIAKLDREMANYILDELEEPKEAYKGSVAPVYIPTRIGEMVVPTVTARVS